MEYEKLEQLGNEIVHILKENKRLKFELWLERQKLLLSCLKHGEKGFISASHPNMGKVDWSKITTVVSSGQGYGFANSQTMEDITCWEDVPLLNESK